MWLYLKITFVSFVDCCTVYIALGMYAPFTMTVKLLVLFGITSTTFPSDSTFISWKIDWFIINFTKFATSSVFPFTYYLVQYMNSTNYYSTPFLPFGWRYPSMWKIGRWSIIQEHKWKSKIGYGLHSEMSFSHILFAILPTNAAGMLASCLPFKSPLPWYSFEERINIIPWSFHIVFFAHRRKITEIFRDWWWVSFHLKIKGWQEVCNIANRDTWSGSSTINLWCGHQNSQLQELWAWFSQNSKNTKSAVHTYMATKRERNNGCSKELTNNWDPSFNLTPTKKWVFGEQSATATL